MPSIYDNLGIETPEEVDALVAEKLQAREDGRERRAAERERARNNKPDTYEPYVDEIATSEASFNSEQVVANARTSLDFLSALAMPTIFKYLFPPVFIQVWHWLTEYAHKTRAFPQLALGLPRGFGKTTVIKLFVLYCILFTKKSFILIISETEGKAKGIVADVCDMLDEPNIKRIFGDWRIGLEQDRQESKKFGFRGRNIIIKAAGSGTGIRGITEKNIRPDVMIFDDIQSREEADSPILSKALMIWMLGTAMKAKSPEGCMFLFIANMYPTPGSLLKKLKANPKWVKFITGGILYKEDHTMESLWEELQPLEQLLAEFENDMAAGQPEVFYAEVLNDENASVNSNIDLSKIPEYPFQDDEIPTGSFVMIDPAGNKIGADDTTIMYFEVIDEKPIAKEVIADILSPGETIRKACMMALKHECTTVFIESNGYQATLKWWFDWVCEQYQITGIDCLEIQSGLVNKNSRIVSMFKSLMAGELLIHPTVWAPVTFQISGFNALKKHNTDGILDCLTYAPRIVAEFGHYIVSKNIFNMQETEQNGVDNFNSPF